MSSKIDSLKDKYNNLSKNAKAAIWATVAICLILLVVFSIVMISSKRRAGGLAGVAVGAHNEARRKVLYGEVPNQPKAVEMPDLEWDSTLADHAHSWSGSCQLGHSQDKRYGENIYYNTLSPENGTFHMKLAVQSWFDEHKHYGYPNSCSGMCGHYTQVVWTKSKKVGCGFTTCNGVAGWSGSKAIMLVCNYDPPGNFNGEPPYRT